MGQFEKTVEVMGTGANDALDWMSGGGRTSVGGPGYDWSTVATTREMEDKARADQEYALQLQKDRIEGKRPSLAEAQLKASTAANVAEQTSMARSAGGGAFGEASANMQAQNNAARMQQQMGGQGAQLRAQEQMNAEQMYAQQASGMRGDAAKQTGQEMNVQLGIGNTNAQLAGAQAQADEAYADRRGLMNMATFGAVGMLSDEREKTDKRRMSDDDMRDFLEDVTAYWYRYKNEPRGTVHAGPMAQDMPHDMVDEGPDGKKRIDLDAAYGAALSALGSLNDRVNKLERGE